MISAMRLCWVDERLGLDADYIVWLNDVLCARRETPGIFVLATSSRMCGPA